MKVQKSSSGLQAKDLSGDDTRLWFILIIGPKHSGKSLCARALGKILGGEAADLDEIVEKQTGKTPRELFIEGAGVFRKAEALALASLFQSPRPEGNGLVIAAGGGLSDNPEALALLAGWEAGPEANGAPDEASLRAESGRVSAARGISAPSHREIRRIITVYLDISAETAWQRILADGELPPFLKTENPEAAHFALHKRRSESCAALASFTVSAENKTAEDIALEIAEYLGKIAEKP